MGKDKESRPTFKEGIKLYKQFKPVLLEAGLEGHYFVPMSSTEFSTFPTRSEALSEGYNRFNGKRFLARPILREQPTIHISTPHGILTK